MTTTTSVRPTEAEAQELPELTPADRIALSLGTRLILWGGQHRVRRAERAARVEQARVAQAAARAEGATDTTFERRALAGPRW